MPTLESLFIIEPPYKSAYRVGDRLEKYGMRVMARYSDGIWQEVFLYSWSPMGPLAESDVSITVSYMGESAIVPISVSAIGDSGYFGRRFLRGAELSGNPAINAGDASVRYRCTPMKIGMESYEISLSLMYCSRMTDRESDMVKGLPKGWRTNFHMLLVSDGVDQSGEDIFKYIDGDGYIHTFVYDQELGCHIDTDGCGLTLDASLRTITDKVGLCVRFDGQGRAISMSDPFVQGKVVCVEYGVNGLRKIYDARRASDYIELSYHLGELRLIKVFRGGAEERSYSLSGALGTISSIEENVGDTSRQIHEFSMNDSRRVATAVDSLTGEACHITYQYDQGLGDYIFSSVRSGRISEGSFAEREGFTKTLCGYHAEGSDQSGITEFRMSVGMSEFVYGVDSRGRIVSSFESINSGRELLSIDRHVGKSAGDIGQSRISINGSIAGYFNGDALVYSGLSSDECDGSMRLIVSGYIKIDPGHEKVMVSMLHLGSSSKKYELSPCFESIWQKFEIRFDREAGQDGRPLAFDNFTIRVEDGEGQPVGSMISDVRFSEPEEEPAVLFEVSGTIVDFDDLESLRITDSLGAAREIPISTANTRFTVGDLVSTLSRRAAFEDWPCRVYFDEGKTVMATYGGVVLRFSNGTEIDIFDPSQLDNSVIGNGRNWYFSQGDVLDGREYRHYGSDSWYSYCLSTRPGIGGGGPERLIYVRRCDYSGRVMEEKLPEGGIFKYEYHPDGTLHRKTAVPPDASGETVLREETEGQGSRTVVEEGVETTSFYNGDSLSSVRLPGSGTPSTVSMSYDAWMRDLTAVDFERGTQLIASNSVSISASRLETMMGDGFSTHKVISSGAGADTTHYALGSVDYPMSFFHSEGALVTTEKFGNDYYQTEFEGFTRVDVLSDACGNVLKVFENDVRLAELSYVEDEFSGYSRLLSEVSDECIDRTTTFQYDGKGRVKDVSAPGFHVSYRYDPGIECKTFTYEGGEIHKYESNGMDSLFSEGDDEVFYIGLQTDCFGRVVGKNIWSYGRPASQSMHYGQNDFSRPTGFGIENVGEAYSYYGGTGKLSARSSYLYSFAIYRNYYYDSFGRLIGESDSRSGITRSYVYSGGRMIRFGSNDIGYDDRGRMTTFGDVSFAYDNYGNMTQKVKDGVLTPYFYSRGKLLSRVGAAVSFEYDYEGVRARKILRNGDVHEYYYEGGKLIGENITNDFSPSSNRRIRYVYDAEGLIGFCVYGLDGQGVRRDFVYIKNPFNEIVGIMEGGEVAAIYDYDAWGNHQVLNPDGSVNADPSFIGNINPIRYKGYYYDVETGLYMMGHRYYDPEIGRFISPDDVEYLDPTKINGLNLYAYCNNDPVNYIDPDGHAPQWLQIAGWIGLGVGAALCIAAIGILAAGVSTATLIGAVAVGAAKGALIGAGIGIGVGAIAGGTGALISGEKLGSGEFWSDVGYGAMTGFGIGAVIGAISGGFSGANGWYNAKALEFTNVGSSEVYLGKDPAYFEIAQQNGGTSFHVSNEVWNSTANMRGVNMWRINKAFLKQQIAIGNRFVLTSYNITGMYAKEVAYVLSHGIWAFLG